jgi:hypothetical protein
VFRTFCYLLIVVALGGCVSTRTSAVDDGSRLNAKTIALTNRPRAGFMASTAGKALFGPLGVVAMEEAGKKIAADNNIEDPAVLVGRDLLVAAENRYGAVAASMPPIQIDITDVTKLAHAAAGADFLLDVQSYGQLFSFFPGRPTYYWLSTTLNVRVIDIPHAKLIAEGHCAVDTRKDPDPPTYDELLADKAARMKAVLNAQSEQCLAKFKKDVLMIDD